MLLLLLSFWQLHVLCLLYTVYIVQSWKKLCQIHRQSQFSSGSIYKLHQAGKTVDISNFSEIHKMHNNPINFVCTLSQITIFFHKCHHDLESYWDTELLSSKVAELTTYSKKLSCWATELLRTEILSCWNAEFMD